MSLCKFQSGGAMFCATPVENLFLEEYMPSAPAEFVKVYLYGLKGCYYPDDAAQDLTRIARALRMSEAQVREAFFYWQQQGLCHVLTGQGAPSVIYNILPRDTRGFSLPEPDRFFDFNQQVDQMFAPRQFTPRELDEMHDWVESLGLPVQSVLLLCEYAIRMHGRDVSMNYMKTVAQNWVSEGLTDPDDIQLHLEQRRGEMRDVSAILASLGIRNRSATEAELALYRKWINQWGFDREAVDFACMQSASAQQPTFKYVDSILSSYHQNGVHVRAEIEDFLSRREQRRSAALAVQNAMGVKGAPSPTLMQYLDEWRNQFGYDVPVFVLAAQEAGRRNQKSIDALASILSGWHRAGLLSLSDVQNHLEGASRTAEDVSRVYDILHLDYAPNEAARSTYQMWVRDWNMPEDVILQGADFVAQSGTQYNRMQMLHRLITQWHEQGVRDVQGAREAYFAQSRSRIFNQNQLRNEALNYQQRNDSLENMYMDL